MRKMKKIAVFCVLSVVGALGLAACGDTPATGTPIAPTTAATTAPTTVTDQPTTVPATVVSEPTTAPTTEPTAMVSDPTTVPTAMVGEPTAAATAGSGGGLKITGPAADAMTKYFTAMKDVQSYHLVQTIDTAAGAITSEGDFQAPDRLRLTSQIAGTNTETIVIGNETYVKQPLGDSYMRVNTGTNTAAEMRNATMIPFINDAQILGDETIDGVATTHLSFTYDAAGLAQQAGMPTPAAGEAKVTTELWVDKSTGQPRQQKIVTAAGTVTQTFSKFNEPVNPPIEKPANVTDGPTMPEIPTVVMPEIPTVVVP